MRRTTALALPVFLCLCVTAIGQQTDVIAEFGFSGGVVVSIGCDDPQELMGLRASNRIVHGLDTREEIVARTRAAIRQAGLDGTVSVEVFDGKRLPYIDNLVNVVVAEKPGALSVDEITRVLAPNGIAFLKGEKLVKPRPDDIDDWSHFFHSASGNPVAADRQVGPPRHMQWEDGPRGTRSHEKMSSVSVVVGAGGRVFSIMDEGPLASVYLPSKWTLTARDAFNGVVLWKRPIETWHSQLFPLKSGPYQLTRRVVATDDRVYVTMGITAPLSEINAATGEVIRTFEGTEHTEEVLHCDGKVIAVVNDSKDPVPFDYPKSKLRTNYTIAVEAKSRSVVVIDVASGKALWSEKGGAITPMTIIADDGKVFFHSENTIRCLDMASGKSVWNQPAPSKLKLATNSSPGLLVQDGVVVFAETNRLSAFLADDGKPMWSIDCHASVYRSPIGACVIDGVIWFPDSNSWETNSGRNGAQGLFVGYDLKSGEKSHEFAPDLDQNVGVCHHRCSMPKATDKYLVTSWPGVEFIDTTTGKMKASHWVRGACLFGSMPANGLVYAPPNPCACYPEGKLNGFVALAPLREDNGGRIADSKRLVKSPAYGAKRAGKAESDSWPTLRRDNERSGSTDVSLAPGLKSQWTQELVGRLTQSVVADGKLFVAAIDAHTVHAFDAKSGSPLWNYTTGGRVDSPPTYHNGTVVFGSRDGAVYCLDATTGELVWKFIAALNDRKTVSFGQLESLWPVSGSVLIQDGVASFAAGKSGFVDGGIVLYRLGAATGKQLSATTIDLMSPDGAQTQVTWLSMPGALPDVLSSDGEYIYMRHIAFDLEGARLDHPGANHLYSANGFVGNPDFHRTFWKVGSGSLQSRIGVPTGEGQGSAVLAMGKERLYHFAREKAITAALKDGEEYFLSSTSQPKTNAQPAGALEPKQRKQGRQAKAKTTDTTDGWKYPSPMRVRAMIVAGETLFIAGPKGEWTHSLDAYEGREGIALMAVSAADGKAIGETALPAEPVYDGMSVAYGNLYVSDKSGVITCYH